MDTASLRQLLFLSAIWGASFLFMRIGAPALGPAILIELRLFSAALFLVAVALYLRKKLPLREHWPHFLVLGFFNSALPFLLFAFAAQTVSASLMAILNATSPIWGALISSARRPGTLTAKMILGLCLGVFGVSVLVGFDAITLEPGAGVALAACIGAAFSYGIAANYASFRQASNDSSKSQLSSFDNAHGSMWAASLMVLPLALMSSAPSQITIELSASVITLGVVCTGFAYLIYFRLMEDIGAASALTVTFLVPVFGVFWGWLVLNEIVGWHTLAGTVIVITGTALVTNFSPSRLFVRQIKNS